MRALTEEEDAVLRRMSALWNQARETKTTADLETAAAFAIEHIDRQWPSDQWTEMSMMIGGTASVVLWSRHHDAERSLLRLRPLAAQILERRWLQGGPNGHFGAEEAQRIMAALGAAEAALPPSAPRPPTPDRQSVPPPSAASPADTNAAETRGRTAGPAILVLTVLAALYVFQRSQPIRGTVESIIMAAIVAAIGLGIRQAVLRRATSSASSASTADSRHSVYTTSDRNPEAFIQRAAGALAGLPKHTFEGVGATTLVVTRSYLAPWRVVLAIVLFPIGLLALIGRDRRTATITAALDGNQVQVALNGAFTDQLRSRLSRVLN